MLLLRAVISTNIVNMTIMQNVLNKEFMTTKLVIYWHICNTSKRRNSRFIYFSAFRWSMITESSSQSAVGLP